MNTKNIVTTLLTAALVATGSATGAASKTFLALLAAATVASGSMPICPAPDTYIGTYPSCDTTSSLRDKVIGYEPDYSTDLDALYDITALIAQAQRTESATSLFAKNPELTKQLTSIARLVTVDSLAPVLVGHDDATPVERAHIELINTYLLLVRAYEYNAFSITKMAEKTLTTAREKFGSGCAIAATCDELYSATSLLKSQRNKLINLLLTLNQLNACLRSPKSIGACNAPARELARLGIVTDDADVTYDFSRPGKATTNQTLYKTYYHRLQSLLAASHATETSIAAVAADLAGTKSMLAHHHPKRLIPTLLIMYEYFIRQLATTRTTITDCSIDHITSDIKRMQLRDTCNMSKLERRSMPSKQAKNSGR